MIQFLYPVKAEDWVTFFTDFLPLQLPVKMKHFFLICILPLFSPNTYTIINLSIYLFLTSVRRVEISSSSKVSIVCLCVMKVFDWLKEYPSNKTSSITRTLKTKKSFTFSTHLHIPFVRKEKIERLNKQFSPSRQQLKHRIK